MALKTAHQVGDEARDDAGDEAAALWRDEQHREQEGPRRGGLAPVLVG
jgi:hypothetical protein